MLPSCKSIIIIEDNPDLREGFKVLLGSESGYVVAGAYESCEAAAAECGNNVPDIILMDIDLPGMDGIEGTRYFKKISPTTEILIFTVFENSHRVFEALCAGASGYLTKNAGHRQLLDALEEIMTGGAPMSANIARMVVGSFQKNKPAPLTDKESEVLELLADGKSYKGIAENLNVKTDTVKFHIKNIYLKLQVSSKEEAIELAKKNKWV